MEVLFNDRSIHGQFDDISLFLQALDDLMTARQLLAQRGLQLICHRAFMQALVTRSTTGDRIEEIHVWHVVQQRLDRDKKQALKRWLDKEGPFWEDERLHRDDDWFEVRGGEIVTDSAIAEAALALMEGESRALWSMAPSDWNYSPITVRKRVEDDLGNPVDIANLWTQDRLADLVRTAEVPPRTWFELLAWAKRACPNLTFSDNAVDSLVGWPFYKNAAREIQRRLTVLDELRACADAGGKWNDRGEELYQTHFVGGKAWFSDSSDTDVNKYRQELTFPHPDVPGEAIFCPWHGKVKIQQMRIHFNFSMSAKEPLYVVYIGPKITKR
jgi:hypothetical protein